MENNDKKNGEPTANNLIRNKLKNLLTSFFRKESGQVEESYENSQDIAKKYSIIEIWDQAKIIDQYDDDFKKEFAEKVITSYNGASAIAVYFDKFGGVLDPNEYAIKIVDAGASDIFGKNIFLFVGLDQNMIVKKMLNSGQTGLFAVSDNLRYFNNLDFEVCLELISLKQGGFVVQSLSSFKDIDYEKLQEKLEETGQYRWISELSDARKRASSSK